jgi:uncharacterized surface protein with fasciclin (FAS1) repeats
VLQSVVLLAIMKFSSIVSGLVLGCCAASVGGQSIADIVSNDTELSTLFLASETAGFTDGLATVEMTLFAPTDAAFAAIDGDLLGLLLTPPWLIHLQALLSHHVVLGTIPSSNITDGLTVDSQLANFNPLGGAPLTFSLPDEGGVFVSGLAFSNSQVIEADIFADNGVIHKVDQVFVPQLLAQTLWEGLQNFPEGFDIFKQFAITTGLDSILNGPDPITVFAVPDAVIGAIPDGALALVNVTEVLLNHIVVGVLPSTSITNGMEIVTLLGMTYTITVAADDTVLIGDVPVVQPNLVASNGIGHVIGGILLPPLSPPVTDAPVVAPTEAPVMPTTTQPTVSAASSAGLLLAFAGSIAVTMLW